MMSMIHCMSDRVGDAGERQSLASKHSGQCAPRLLPDRGACASHAQRMHASLHCRLCDQGGHARTDVLRCHQPPESQILAQSAHALWKQETCLACRSIKHVKGDRNDDDAVKDALSGKGFDAVYDINGREANQVEPILDAIPDLEQYIFCSSAGVYKQSPVMPHRCASQ